ncbi:MAG: Chaperone protein DnaJ [Parcubacteria group bacterium GW2011_GWF2_38_76]|nr:MAG: Chaperone protein DnaJ [Parcubacteria group bacterium GW2011_GWF2_38_76]HBM46075.1 molecular chaperone DnaJ [Patescibacteria group bacterium]
MDYYKVLGVEKNASKEDIKKAFHKLAHKHHPDKKGGDEKKFKEINEAYQTLSDDEKRSQYDRYGKNFGGGAGPQGFSGFGNGGGFGFDFGDMFRGGGEGVEFDASNVEDLFSSFFGGGRSGRGKVKRGRDISADILISFSESIFGIERKIQINKVSVCDICSGTGAKKGSAMVKCKTCDGTGKIIENERSFLGTFATERVCDKCFGAGENPKENCPNCKGEGVLKKNEEILVKVPAGIEDGQMIRFSGRGEAVPHGSPGDLYVKIHVEKHPTWRREGINLVTDLEIKLTDALLGTIYKLKTLDGEMDIKIPEGISFGEILRIKGKGVPTERSGRGDIHINIRIKIPKKLSKKEEEFVRKLKEEGL